MRALILQALGCRGLMAFARYESSHRGEVCKCVLQNGEWMFGHVMELVDGPTVDMKTADELGLDGTVQPQEDSPKPLEEAQQVAKAPDQRVLPQLAAIAT
ncbi:hypothetical protein JB92DRAFT_2919093 [Gautieria morchelliformis]|nr:hypothetical protein JB92DRAFT_2919093 [Gautieria morchelliformis]